MCLWIIFQFWKVQNIIIEKQEKYIKEKKKLYLQLSEYIFTKTHYDVNFVIAKTMMEHINEFPDISLKELAYFANTSEGSISKFCKELGFTNFKDLRSEEFIYQPNPFFEELSKEIKNHSIDEAFIHFQTNIDNYEKQAIDYLDESVLESVSKKVKYSKNIAIYTGLHGYAAMNLLHNILLPFDIFTYRINRDSDNDVISSVNSNSELIIVISLTEKWINKKIENNVFDDQSLSRTILITHEQETKYADKFMSVISFKDTKDFYSSTYISDRILKALVIKLFIYLSK